MLFVFMPDAPSSLDHDLVYWVVYWVDILDVYGARVRLICDSNRYILTTSAT